MKKNLIISIGLMAVVVLGVGIYNQLNTEEPMAVEASQTTMETVEASQTTMMANDGKEAPDFDLKNLSGTAVSLESLKGERVYLKFWASWCSICLAGMDELDELAATAEDFKVITIVSPDFNGEQSSEDFIAWFDSLGYENITVLLDPDGDIAKEYGVRGYPTSVYIGSDTILVKQLPGHVDNASILESFEAIY